MNKSAPGNPGADWFRGATRVDPASGPALGTLTPSCAAPSGGDSGVIRQAVFLPAFHHRRVASRGAAARLHLRQKALYNPHADFVKDLFDLDLLDQLQDRLGAVGGRRALKGCRKARIEAASLGNQAAMFGSAYEALIKRDAHFR